MIAQFFASLLLAATMIWAAGSLVILYMKPWRHVDPEDRWLACLMVALWPFVLLSLLFGIVTEFRIDRREGRCRRGH